MIPRSTARPSTWWKIGRVGRVGGLAPVHPADRDHVDGRLSLLHDVDLGRRGLGSQDDVLVQEERLQLRARRMRRRQVERVEVVVRRLDLAAVDDAVAESEEDVLDLPADLCDEMELPARRCPAGKRDVDLLLRQPALQILAGERRLTLGDLLLELLAQGVEHTARLRVAYLAEGLLQLALPTEVAHPRIVELGEGRSARNRALRLIFQALDIHRRSVSSCSCRPMTPSPRSTTRGAAASPRTSTSTSHRQGSRAGPSSSSASAPGGSPSRSRRRACA